MKESANHRQDFVVLVVVEDLARKMATPQMKLENWRGS